MAAHQESNCTNLEQNIVADSWDGDEHNFDDSVDKKNEVDNDATRYSDRNLIINYIPSALTDQQLLLLFSRVGTVRNCRIIRDKHTQQSFGFGFCEFETAQHAQEAIALFNGHKVGGKILKVAFARLPGQESKNCNLFIQNLPTFVDREELQRVFSQFGRIVQCRLIVDSQGRSRRIGFVLYENRSAAAAARDALNDRVWPAALKVVFNEVGAESTEVSFQSACDEKPEEQISESENEVRLVMEESILVEFPPSCKEVNLVKVQFAAENSKKCRSILGTSNSSRTESAPLSTNTLIAPMNTFTLGSTGTTAGRYMLPAPWCDMATSATAIPVLPSPTTAQLPYPLLLNFAGTSDVVPLVFNAPINLGSTVGSKTGVSAYRPSLLSSASQFSSQISGLPFQSPVVSLNQSPQLIFPVHTATNAFPAGPQTHSSTGFLSVRSPSTCTRSLLTNANSVHHLQHALGVLSGGTCSLGNSGRLVNAPPAFHQSQLSPPSEPPFVLYIYNIGNNMTEEILRELFKPYGSPRKIDVPRDSSSNTASGNNGTGVTRSKNYGFVTYDNLDSALAAMRALNGLILEGRQLQVSFRKEKTQSAIASISTGKGLTNNVRMRMINSALQQSQATLFSGSGGAYLHQPWVTVANTFNVSSTTTSSATA